MAGADDIYGDAGMGEPPKKNKPAEMYGQGHWNMGEQGAAGAWSGGYNPQWETDGSGGQPPPAFSGSGQLSAPQTNYGPMGALGAGESSSSQSVGMSQQDWLGQGGSMGDWLVGNPDNNPRANNPAPEDIWTPFKASQSGQAGWDEASQSFAPEKGYRMGQWADASPTDAAGNGIDPLADPDNMNWGNGMSYNQHVADTKRRQGEAQTYNDEEDARYQRELDAWNKERGLGAYAPSTQPTAAQRIFGIKEKIVPQFTAGDF